MPFTPYHFGPSGLVGLFFRKRLDLPVFVLANVIVDFEPLVVLVFNLECPVHGISHTFLFGAVLGLLWGLVTSAAGGFGWLMKVFGLTYQSSVSKMIISGLLGVWFHVFVDSFCWADVRPLWPIKWNPLVGLVTLKMIYLFCIISFVPAIVLYIFAVLSFFKDKRE